MPDDYQPVACSLHSEYELMAMHRDQIQLEYSEGQQQYSVTGQVIDLVTRNGAEFLCITSAGQQLQIRLDHIARLKKIAD